MDISYNDEGTSSSSPPRRTSTDPAASPASSQSAQPNDSPPECERIRQLRLTLGVSDDIPSSVLRAILEANDREASERALSQENSPEEQSSIPPSSSSYTNTTNGRMIRTWDTCQNAPSRPGILRIDTEGTRQNIGQVDEASIYSRRVEAIHLVQENLHRRLGRGRGIDREEFDAMARREEEEERRLNVIEVMRPSVMEWDVPMDPGLIRRREPFLPPPTEEALPLPDSLTRVNRERELCMGIFVDSGQNGEEFEEGSSWASVSVDVSPLDENEIVVRCYRCRAGLKVYRNTGLVICPRCRSISPAADVVNFER